MRVIKIGSSCVNIKLLDFDFCVLSFGGKIAFTIYSCGATKNKKIKKKIFQFIKEARGKNRFVCNQRDFLVYRKKRKFKVSVVCHKSIADSYVHCNECEHSMQLEIINFSSIIDWFSLLLLFLFRNCFSSVHYHLCLDVLMIDFVEYQIFFWKFKKEFLWIKVKTFNIFNYLKNF